MHILIVGGTGVLSSAVTAEALSQGISVTMINRGNNPIPNGVELIRSDRNDISTIERVLANRSFDAVMDFLCLTDDETEKSISFYSNYTNQYFYISSCAVYNTKALNGKKGNEESPKVLDIWDYSIGKWNSELKVMSLAAKYDIHYTIIRPCVTYGDTRIPYGISPMYGYHGTLIARILHEKPIIRWNGGTNRCNMMRVEDFAVGVVGLVGNEKANNESFNICGDEMPSFNDVLDALSKTLNKKVITVDMSSSFYADEIPYRRGELLGGRSIDALNSNDKIKRVVPEFKQTITLEEGIKRTVDAYLDQNYQKGIDWAFDAETDRVIKKWCKQQGIILKQYNLGFIDYLGNASMPDKFFFYKLYCRDMLVLKFMRKIKNLMKS